jgi:hypothetical protein
MYGIARHQVEALLHALGGRVLHVEPNQLAGPDWTSFTYYVAKGFTSSPSSA